MPDLGPATSEVIRLLDGVPDDALSGPTPCPDYPVAALLDHLMGLSLAFTWAAEKSTAEHAGTEAPAPGTSTAERLDPDWRKILPGRLEELAAAWRRPEAWEGVAEAGGVTMPADMTAAVAVDELVLHGWDLARATGQSFRCDPVSIAVVLEFAGETAKPGNAEMRAGLFGPVVAVPAGAPDLDRAVALAGRDPAWTPSGG